MAGVISKIATASSVSIKLGMNFCDRALSRDVWRGGGGGGGEGGHNRLPVYSSLISCRISTGTGLYNLHNNVFAHSTVTNEDNHVSRSKGWAKLTPYVPPVGLEATPSQVN